MQFEHGEEKLDDTQTKQDMGNNVHPYVERSECITFVKVSWKRLVKLANHAIQITIIHISLNSTSAKTPEHK
jgi:hypothetical protein